MEINSGEVIITSSNNCFTEEEAECQNPNSDGYSYYEEESSGYTTTIEIDCGPFISSGGGTAGAVVGVLIVIVICIVVGCYFYKKSRA